MPTVTRTPSLAAQGNATDRRFRALPRYRRRARRPSFGARRQAPVRPHSQLHRTPDQFAARVTPTRSTIVIRCATANPGLTSLPTARNAGSGGDLIVQAAQRRRRSVHVGDDSVEQNGSTLNAGSGRLARGLTGLDFCHSVARPRRGSTDPDPPPNAGSTVRVDVSIRSTTRHSAQDSSHRIDVVGAVGPGLVVGGSA